jgi:hypothetical protein
LDVAEAIPGLKGRSREERYCLRVRKTDGAEYIEENGFEADPGEREVDTMEGEPVEFEFPVGPFVEGGCVGECYCLSSEWEK